MRSHEWGCDAHVFRLDDELEPAQARRAQHQDAQTADVRRHMLREAGTAWDRVFGSLRAEHPPTGPADVVMVTPIPTGDTYAVSRHVGKWVRRVPRP